MNHSDKNAQESPRHPGGGADARKPYEKPDFVREQLFETMALACGKISATQGPCRLVRKTS
jgi:hypothetical protein